MVLPPHSARSAASAERAGEEDGRIGTEGGVDEPEDGVEVADVDEYEEESAVADDADEDEEDVETAEEDEEKDEEEAARRPRGRA